MKKEIKDLWVTALRSGKYQQGNDSGMTFDQIADIIDRYWEQL